MKKLLDRDLSWMSFNKRVLDETKKNIPASEKLLFYGICHSNLDEFFMSRYPSKINDKDIKLIKDLKKSSRDMYDEINTSFKEFNKSYRVLKKIKELTTKERHKIMKIFDNTILPIITPITVGDNNIDAKNKDVFIFVETEYKGKSIYNYIQVPNIDRFIRLDNSYVAIEDIIIYNLHKIFRKMNIKNKVIFRVLRSSEIGVIDDELSYFKSIERTLKERERSWITLLEVSNNATKDMVNEIKSYLNITKNTIVVRNDYISLTHLKSLGDSIFTKEEKIRTNKPSNPFKKNKTMFELINKKDRIVFHPFQSFKDSFLRFLKEACRDSNVKSIKITLYRVAEKSKIIDYLLEACNNGISVTVLVELKARFDEKHNILISKILKEAGVNLIYGDSSLKVHAKTCIITRMEGDKIVTYSHIGTGNYNESNAKIYTDYSYFTNNPKITKEVNQFFSFITSKQKPFKTKNILYAPYNLRDKLLSHIDEEINKGEDGRIIIKCNSLTDDSIINKLYKASSKGVKIRLIVRGSCSLRPGVKGLSENIKVISIIGKYLEHSRIYKFGKGKKAKLIIGSNDLMHRNLDARNELAIYITDEKIHKEISTHLKMYLKDDSNSRTILDDYKYKESTGKYDCHMKFIKKYK